MPKKKCKTCAAGVSGMNDIPVNTIAAAIVAAIAIGQVDQMVSFENGQPRDNFFAKNKMAKNAAYLAAGIFLTSMPGELYQGAGTGLAVYGGFNLAQDMLEISGTGSIYGNVKFIRPTSLSGIKGYGIEPSILGSNEKNRFQIPKEYEIEMDYEQPMFSRAL